MAKRRFTLAIADLTARGLVEESKNPMLVPDRLDLQLVERFVRQDPADPITITALYLQAPARPALNRQCRANRSRKSITYSVDCWLIRHRRNGNPLRMRS